MAASNFVQEMRSVGERLLLKLQRLPQAEPVEIVAFSVILLFTGQLGLSDLPSTRGSSRHPGAETMALARGLGEVAGCPPGRGGEAGVPWEKPKDISQSSDMLLE